MAEWASADSYFIRIGRILGSIAGGLNNPYFLKVSGTGQKVASDTVFSDPSIDQLFGEAGQNWFWYTSAGSFIDVVQDITGGQVATALPR